jgi:CheY-like chemotaxis protein
MAEMLTDYFHLDARYEIESVEYCDDALAVLQRPRFDLVLVLSLHVPWTMRPSSYSATWGIDFANAILFLKHLRALHSPPVILISGSLLAEAKEEALANRAFAFLPNQWT